MDSFEAITITITALVGFADNDLRSAAIAVVGLLGLTTARSPGHLAPLTAAADDLDRQRLRNSRDNCERFAVNGRSLGSASYTEVRLQETQ